MNILRSGVSIALLFALLTTSALSVSKNNEVPSAEKTISQCAAIYPDRLISSQEAWKIFKESYPNATYTGSVYSDYGWWFVDFTMVFEEGVEEQYGRAMINARTGEIRFQEMTHSILYRSQYAEQAISYIRKKVGYKIAITGVTESDVDRKLTNRHFWVGKISVKDHTYEVYICKDTGKNFDSIDSFCAEENALQELAYGKLDGLLYHKLEIMDDEDIIEVDIRLHYQEDPNILEETKKHFPDIVFDGSIPVIDFGFERMNEEISLRTAIYNFKMERVDRDIAQLKRPFIDKLNRNNITILSDYEHSPSFTVSVTKQEVMNLKEYPEISRIHETIVVEDCQW